MPVYRLPSTLTAGKEIIVKGVPGSCFVYRFSFNFCTGDDHHTDTALHFDVRFDQKLCVRKHRDSGSWGKAETGGGFPFDIGVPYEVKFVVTDTQFQVFVDDKHFTNFNHRIPCGTAKNLYIEGDTKINDVSVTDETQVLVQILPHKDTSTEEEESVTDPDLSTSRRTSYPILSFPIIQAAS